MDWIGVVFAAVVVMVAWRVGIPEILGTLLAWTILATAAAGIIVGIALAT